MGESADLEPFSRSLGIAASFAFPRGIVDLAPRGLRGRSWWPLDVEERAAALSRGARDLSGFVPEGLAEARAFLDQQLDQLSSGEDERSRPLVIGGFSQGAMLACDSGARIAAEEWKPRYETRRGLPIFVSHGRKDDDLSFSAAEAFQQELSASGWLVTWCPFDGRHEIPIVVWRSFRRWLSSIPGRAT
jgi:phospholipase/carboxylesterase